MKKNICFWGVFIGVLFIYSCQQPLRLYVSTTGNDKNEGTEQAPLRSLEKAKTIAIEKLHKKPLPVEIILKEGTYYLDKPLVFSAEEMGELKYPFVVKGESDSEIVVSGGIPLELSWKPYDSNIWKATVQETDKIAALYTQRGRLPMARYPNFEADVYPYGGFAKDAISPERVASWEDPAGGFIHAMHQGRWGGMHYRITGKNKDNSLEYEGGWQNNRPSDMHVEQRFVENIFEELDTEGEWFFDEKEKAIYYYPFEGEHPNEISFIAGRLESLVQIKGSSKKPVRKIVIKNITFSHTVPTFMKTQEQLMRSDWSIYREGAVLLAGTENCVVENNNFQHLGGNGIFVSGYNRQGKIKGNLIEHIGASGIAFVGESSAVRSPSYRYGEFVSPHEMDTLAGPKTDDYPADFVAEDNLIRHIGEIEKQVAGVQIQMASRIKVSHNTIYKVPRAGINIGDGAWGGHILEYNDVFETVLETGDHGAFNSWGRDRFWHPNRKIMDELVSEHPTWILLDAQETTKIRHNRFHCDYGWDIDLDDGSSNYEIYNNLCLSGGIKLREGFHRKVYNNMTINNGFHPHVWFLQSGDEFKHNLVMTTHQPIGVEDWGNEVDSNFFTSKRDLEKAQSWGVDEHSYWGDPEFVNPESGDFHLSKGNQFLSEGFKQLDFEEVGVYSSRLVEKADKAPVPEIILDVEKEEAGAETIWRGITVKTVENLGEQSAAGLNEIKGVLIKAIPEESPLYRQGLQEGDVILSCFDEPTDDVTDLKKQDAANRWKGRMELGVWRNQKLETLTVRIER